jgi:hypothetical protein
MIPVPKVQKVTRPRCSRCSEPSRLVKGRWTITTDDGPPLCRDCVALLVRLAGVAS